MPAPVCPYCGEPAAAGHTACAGLFGHLMRSGPAPMPEDLPEEALPHAADPERRVNQYVLTEAVGQGGMGTVWKAWDTRLSRWTAVKFLRGALAEDAARFAREARLAAGLQHPNIAPVIEFVEAPRPFLAMAFVDGPSLAAAELTARQAADVFVKVARAVETAHRAGVLHRDLKPGNILLSRDGWPYVTDFGLARRIDAPSSMTASGEVLGTPSFMAPEQAEGRPADARSDVYALGAALYAVLCGRAPFEGDNPLSILHQVVRGDFPPPRKVRPDLPDALEAVVLKAMARRPEDRYATAGAMADDLERFLADAPVGAPGRRRPWRALGVVGGLTAAVVAIVLARPLEKRGEKVARHDFHPPLPKAEEKAAFEDSRPREKVARQESLPREKAEALLRGADRASRGERDAARRELAALAAEHPGLAAIAARYPVDLEEADRVDPGACLRSPDPAAACARLEEELRPLVARTDLTRDCRRTLLTALLVAGAQQRLLLGRSEEEAARELSAHAAAFRVSGGTATDVYGPRVASVLAKVLSN